MAANFLSVFLQFLRFLRFLRKRPRGGSEVQIELGGAGSPSLALRVGEERSACGGRRRGALGAYINLTV